MPFCSQIKEVTPMKTLSSPMARFWKEDVKIARNYAASLDPDTSLSLGDDFIREWVVSVLICIVVYYGIPELADCYSANTGTNRSG